jgi:tetratricopeptide (TPR) repeat protein
MSRAHYILFLLLLQSSIALHGQMGYHEAVEAYHEARYGDARTILDSLLNKAEDAKSFMLRADCLHKEDRFDAALDDYNRAALFGYNKDDLYLNRGICKTSLHMFDEARNDLMTYLARHESEAAPYYWVGVVEYMSMQNRAAIRYLDEAIYLDSAYTAAYYLRGAAFVEQGKNLLAMEDFSEAYHLDPYLHRAKFHMALLYLDMGQDGRAIETLSELKLEETEYLAEILYYRGLALFNLHDLEGACNDWIEASSMGDDEAENSYKNVCLRKDGKPKLKKKHYVEF